MDAAPARPASARARSASSAASRGRSPAGRSRRGSSRAHHAASSASGWNAVGRLPEPRQQLDQDVERALAAGRGEERPGLAALEQQRAARRRRGEQPDRAVAVPALERVRLVLGLAVRVVDLEHGRRPVRRARRARRGRRSRACTARRASGPTPPRISSAMAATRSRQRAIATGRVGHRYASAWRFASDGSFARMSRSRARSISATITVSSSGAWASTMPHGSAISDRPYAGLPGSVSPTCPAAAT